MWSFPVHDSICKPVSCTAFPGSSVCPSAMGGSHISCVWFPQGDLAISCGSIGSSPSLYSSREILILKRADPITVPVRSEACEKGNRIVHNAALINRHLHEHANIR